VTVLQPVSRCALRPRRTIRHICMTAAMQASVSDDRSADPRSVGPRTRSPCASPMDNNTIGERLRTARNQAGYTQRQVVAGRDNLSESTLSRWEKGDVSAPFSGIMELADLYGVSLDWIAGRSESPRLHTIAADSLLVDSELLSQFQALTRGPVSDTLVAPAPLFAWRVPRSLDIYCADAATYVVSNIHRKIRDLRGT
jgi:transcriptional regulator with XRE-family HTH domain